jgi:uncharacterized protein
MRTILLGAALAFGLATAATAQNCSFNCNSADRPDEVLICQRADLCQLDIQMSSRHFRLRNVLSGRLRSALMADQTAWLRGRFQCGRDYACINAAYRSRIRQLDQDY